ncbi:zinc finger protein 585A [Anabrus simplex]|uniref:zinc finger protein 585A n=1 Tax=Anabrus simplex TaxID=316456 RepID=UPI0035A296FA
MEEKELVQLVLNYGEGKVFTLLVTRSKSSPDMIVLQEDPIIEARISEHDNMQMLQFDDGSEVVLDSVDIFNKVSPQENSADSCSMTGDKSIKLEIENSFDESCSIMDEKAIKLETEENEINSGFVKVENEDYLIEVKCKLEDHDNNDSVSDYPDAPVPVLKSVHDGASLNRPAPDQKVSWIKPDYNEDYNSANSNKDFLKHNNNFIEADNIGHKLDGKQIIEDAAGEFYVIDKRCERDSANTKELSYICALCNEKFNTRHMLERHVCTALIENIIFNGKVNSSNNEQIYQCNICEVDFRSRQLLETHECEVGMDDTKLNIANSKEIGSIACDICGVTFEDEALLDSHICEHQKMKVVCAVCRKTFLNKSLLQKHITAAHTKLVKNMCSHCGVVYPSKASLKIHQCFHTAEQSCLCPFCNKQFDQIADLKEHVRIHSSGKLLSCSLCEQWFVRDLDFTNHMSSHSKRRETSTSTHTCNTCGKICESMLLLHQHIKIHMNQCKTCGKQFKALASLRRHKNSHKSIFPFKCGVCHKAFRARLNLARHMLVHSTDSKVHQCLKCGQNFPRAFLLLCHQRMHVRQYKLTCKVCKRYFETFYELDKHLASHQGENLYRCDKCPLSFSDITSFMEHQKGHDLSVVNFGVSYTCEKCGKLFKTRSAYFNHRNKEDKKLVCDVCGKFCPNKTLLRRHRLSHLGMRPFLCTRCGKRFTDKSVWKVHQRVHTGERPYKCLICMKSFAYRSSIVQHKQRHTGTLQKNFQCKICGKCFIGPSQLERHHHVHSGERKFQCTVCDKWFIQMSHLQEHQVVHTRVRDFTCETCGKAYLRRSDLKKHLSTHDEQRTLYKCVSCQREFINKGNLKKHLEVQNGEGPCKGVVNATCVCEKCGKVCNNRTALRAHQSLHRNWTALTCRVCGKSFRQISHLVSHIKSHEDGQQALPHIFHLQKEESKPEKDDLLMCDRCGKLFPGVGSLRLHELKNCQDPSKKVANHKCEECPLTFQELEDLVQHRKSHHAVTPDENGKFPYKKKLTCDECGKRLSSIQNLVRHKLVHTGSRPHVCKHCDKSFTQKAHLTEHERTHTGIRPFVCTVCGKTFSYRSSYIQHQSQHNQKGAETRLACDICGKHFTEKLRLERHRFKHLGERPYACEVCHKRFYQSSHLSDHRVVHTRERNFLCDICNRRFMRRSDLRKHLITHSEMREIFRCDKCSRMFLSKRFLKIHKCKEESKPKDSQSKEKSAISLFVKGMEIPTSVCIIEPIKDPTKSS